MLLVPFLNWLVDKLPTLNIPEWVFPSVLIDIINTAWYFLPMGTINTLFVAGLYITCFRLGLAIFVRLRDTIFSL